MATYADVLAIANAAVPAGTYSTTDSEPPFAKLVRSASFILTENDPFSYEKIQQITPPTYWDAFIYLAAKRKALLAAITRNADGSTQISTSNDINQEFLYIEDDVVAMLTPGGVGSSGIDRYNSYGDGIQWYIAKLVAAHLVRNIPLNTSSIKQVDIADNLEKQAYDGLERIVKLTDVPLNSSNTSSDDSDEEGQVTLYIAHDLNKATIPEGSFNIPDTGSSPPTYNSPVDLGESVDILDGTITPAGFTSFCYFYMTGEAYTAQKDAILGVAQNENSRSVSFRVEDVFEVPNDTNIDELIMMVAENINTKTLTELHLIPGTEACVSNILVGPQRGRDKIESFRVYKKLLYPQTATLKTRQATFKTCHRVNHLTFDVRRMSNKVSNELLTIAFYTTVDTNWTDYQSSTITLSQLRATANLGIDGLIFGQQESYYQMAGTSPVSFVLKVDKGNATPVSIQDAGTSTDPSDQFGDAGDLAKTDTFYFAVNDPFTSFSSNLILRISSTDYLAEAPAIITVDLAGILPAATPPPNCVGEQVAERVVEAIYQYTRDRNKNQDILDNSNVLGVLLGQYQYEYLNINRDENTVTPLDLTDAEPKDDDAGRVQIVGFRYKDEEFKIVVDLIQVPPELCVATGNYLTRRTLWVQGKPRSICVETKVLTSNTSTNQTEAEVLASVASTVVPAEASISPLLQKVYDKQRLLKDAAKGYPRRWQDS